MMDIVSALKQELLAYIDPGVSEDDFSYTLRVSHCNILKWFDALDRLSAQQREPGVRVKELVWKSAYGYRARSVSSVRIYTISEYPGMTSPFKLEGLENWGVHFDTLDAAKSAAQADYEQRIMAAIEIQSSDGGVEGHALSRSLDSTPDPRGGIDHSAHTESEAAGIKPGPSDPHDGGSPGPSPLAVSFEASDPASGRSQPSPDVSVDELAKIIEAEIDFDVSGNIAWAIGDRAARALLSRFRIERLDRLASSGRR